MSKHSSDSNSRNRTKNHNRYFHQRHRSSSSTSPENSRHSKRNSSKFSSRYTSSKRRSDSPSEYSSSSRHKHSNRSSHYKDRIPKKKNQRSSSSDESNHSNSSHNQPKGSKSVAKYDTPINENDTNWVEKNVYDVMKRENSIEQISQEGFVFKVFKPLNEKRQDEIIDRTEFDVPKFNEEIITGLPVEDSTFLISNRERLLNGRLKLLTKQERCIHWAKYLFASYKPSES